jgi:hypothetical protein
MAAQTIFTIAMTAPATTKTTIATCIQSQERGTGRA